MCKSDFYNSEEHIEIEIIFYDIDEKDIKRLTLEHRERIKELMKDGELVLTRQYSTDGKSELLCSRLSPKDARFNKEVIVGLMKGKSGKDVSSGVVKLFPEYQNKLEGLTTQKAVNAELDEIIAELLLSKKN